MRLPILYQDADLVAVDKPPGVPTHAADPADPYPADALRATKLQTGLDYAGMHQRLDADTSGVLLFAARREANKALSEAFAGRIVQKTYLALVHGVPRNAEGRIEGAIGRDRDGRYRIDERGQPAATRYRILEALPREELSLLEVIPETGRSHQIRLHLTHLGHPVVGDQFYGPPDRPAPRLGLHAYRLSLPHPTGQTITELTASPPAMLIDLGSTGPALKLAAAGLHITAMLDASPAWRTLLDWSVVRRSALQADPQTTICRLVHGRADGLRGLTVDRYGDALVASLYHEEDRSDPMPDRLVAALAESTGATSIHVKVRPKFAGQLGEEDLAELAPRQPAYGQNTEEVVALEDGLSYVIRPGVGLSSGLFADMREGRGRVRAWANEKRVLNCFAYTCAFGVAAISGGATRVLNLDLAKPALDWGRANYEANRLPVDPHDFVYGDVFDWLSRLARRGELFDMVILDPPGYSRNKKRRFSMARDLPELVALAARCLAPDGLMMVCGNVAELPWRSFRDRALAGIAAAGRTAEVVGVYHEPALDYPTPVLSEPYLKQLWLRFGQT